MKKNRNYNFFNERRLKDYLSSRPKSFCCAGAGRGFTMIEMMMVVALMALLAGIGGGLYKGTMEGMLVKKAARDFYLAARYARMLAVESQRPCRIEMDRANNSFAVVSEQINEQTGEVETLAVKNYYAKTVKFADGIRFEDVQIFSNDSDGEASPEEQIQSILFFPNGTVQASVIQIGDGKTHYTAGIYPSTGRVKIYFGQAENIESQVIDLDQMR
jgi:prepilin-type N-terminal cleavage/methylation domain-containing protein